MAAASQMQLPPLSLQLTHWVCGLQFMSPDGFYLSQEEIKLLTPNSKPTTTTLCSLQ